MSLPIEDEEKPPVENVEELDVDTKANAIARAAFATMKPKSKKHLLQRISESYGIAPDKVVPLLQKSIFPKFDDAHVLTALIIADQAGLDPFANQINLFLGKGGRVIPYIPIDGAVARAHSCPEYRGCSFEITEYGDDELIPYIELMDPGTIPPKAVRCTIFVEGRAPLTIEETYAECVWGYYDDKKIFNLTEPWRRKPRRMTRHKAFIQAQRLALPGLRYIPDEDEARRMVEMNETFSALMDKPIRYTQDPPSSRADAVITALGGSLKNLEEKSEPDEVDDEEKARDSEEPEKSSEPTAEEITEIHRLEREGL